MSLPDYLLDDDDDDDIIYCNAHRHYRPCFECDDNIDLYADAKIQDAQER